VDTGVHTAADSGFNYFTVGRNRSISPRDTFRLFCSWRSPGFGRATVAGGTAQAFLVESNR